MIHIYFSANYRIRDSTIRLEIKPYFLISLSGRKILEGQKFYSKKRVGEKIQNQFPFLNKLLNY